MQETVAAPLVAWGTFYVIVGSSAAALTGLQFVVMTLIAPIRPGTSRGESIPTSAQGPVTADRRCES